MRKVVHPSPAVARWKAGPRVVDSPSCASKSNTSTVDTVTANDLMPFVRLYSWGGHCTTRAVWFCTDVGLSLVFIVESRVHLKEAYVVMAVDWWLRVRPLQFG